MTNNYNMLPDGRLVYDQPFQNRSSYYTSDPENPRIVIPKVPVCRDRRIELRTLSCGRVRGDWKCTQYGLVSPKVCNQCQTAVQD